MKLKRILAIPVLLTLLVAGCSVKSNELATSINVLTIDSIKTSPKGIQRTFEFDIKGDDEGGNIKSFSIGVNNARAMMNGENVTGRVVMLTQPGERYNFTRTVEVVPTADGLHTITVTQYTAFNQATSFEKRLYSFNNMEPKVGVTYSTQRQNDSLVLYAFDFSTTLDHDERWGGGIDSIFIKADAQSHPDAGWTLRIGAATHGLNHTEPIFDDSINFYTDLWCWAKDNDGATSDTAHFSIGHVEALPAALSNKRVKSNFSAWLEKRRLR